MASRSSTLISGISRLYPAAVPTRRAAAALSVVLLAGCGAGSGQAGHRRARGGGTQAAATRRPLPYRWLIDPSATAPGVSAENAYAGTGSWRLDGGPAAQLGGVRSGGVEGYVAEQAVLPGQIQRIYVNAPGARRVRVAIFRMGWYGGRGGREVLVSRWLALRRQPPCLHRPLTGLTECRWHPALSFPVPPALPSGVYIAKLITSSGQSDCLFVVRAPRPSPLLVQLATTTYEAYNAWGGDSLYPGGRLRVGVTGTGQGVSVSYDRPYDSITGAGQFFARDVAMVRFLERYGYPVSYTTDASVSADPGQLAGPRAVMDLGHSEYWSEPQAEAFARARERGESLLFFSSDTLGWRVRYAPASPASSRPGAPAHVVIAYKEHAALDPDRAQPSGPFPGGGAALAGSAYLGCITPRLDLRGPPVYRYYSWRLSSLAPAWLLAGTRLSAGSSVPGIVGYELDQRTAASPAGVRLLGYGEAPCQATEPGEPRPGPGQDLAETTIYTAPSGALVFATGTLGWELGLEPVPSASPDAPRAPERALVRLTRNLLDHVLR